MPATARTDILLLALENNQRGDLFTRLGKDLFFALGYDELDLGVSKSGRELDISGQHRHEARALVAEFKATAKPIGGDDLNKFLGVLTRERGRKGQVAGYFVSLGGFTETARQQEQDDAAAGVKDGMILFDAAKVVAELEHSGQLISHARAMEQAGVCRSHAGLQDAQVDGSLLLGTEQGYLWAVFYAHHKKRTHYALIHADGTPLAQAVAEQLLTPQLLQANPDWEKAITDLHYLAPPEPDAARRKLAAEADERYRQWLAEECGYMQLDGLPTDADLGRTRPRLERLYVPLRAYLKEENAEVEALTTRQKARWEIPQAIGTLLGTHSCLALLAAPGGGKSTLLKRLATAYAMPERLNEIADDLPAQNWLPLFLRCRDLGAQARQPILSLLQHICQCAGMTAEQASLFQENIHNALRAGRVLLLVDGLDELAELGSRQAFVQNLRTFVGMFPGTRLLLTSREAGFRAVAGVVASLCHQLTMAPLDDEDITTICQRWYAEVYPDDAARQREAEQLAATIHQNERIRNLAQNPLLLTTLLVVKRSTRELPRKRADLYKAAVTVLVRTWNTEGHEALDEEETIIQLCFIACAMMQQGVQKLPRPALLALLKQAQQELEAELRHIRLSPAQFIERTELRSSLLMQTGRIEYEGSLEPVYEFRHLTFQEYLCALGLVQEYYAGRAEGQALEDVLEPYLKQASWREVISLAAVLAKRKAEGLVAKLVATCAQQELASQTQSWHLLHQALLDQVALSTPSLKAVYLQVGRDWPGTSFKLLTPVWAEDRAGLFYATLAEKFWQDQHLYDYMFCFTAHAGWKFAQNWPWPWGEAALTNLAQQLAAEAADTRIAAALTCVQLIHDEATSVDEARLLPLPGLQAMLGATSVQEQLAAAWALVIFVEYVLPGRILPTHCLLRFFKLWQQYAEQKYSFIFAKAIACQALHGRDAFANADWGDCDAFLGQMLKREYDRWEWPAAFVINWYRRGPLSDAELVAALAEAEAEDTPFRYSVRRHLLANLGPAGLAVLTTRNNERQN